jgi:hypothetical protein
LRPARRFYFRLALALGYAHPDFLLCQLSSAQIAEWMAYYRLEPFGEGVRWLRAGTIASVIANVFRGKGSRVLKPSDFMPEEPKPPTPPQTTDEQKNALSGLIEWARRAGKLVEKKRGQ